MPTLKEFASTYSGKKELYDLDKISVDIEFKSGEFDSKDQKNADGTPKKIPFQFIEVDGYKYTIKAKVMEQVKAALTFNPSAKFIKFQKAPNGDINVIPIL